MSSAFNIERVERRLASFVRGEEGRCDLDIKKCAAYLAAKVNEAQINGSNLRISSGQDDSPFPTTIQVRNDGDIYIYRKKSQFAEGTDKKVKQVFYLNKKEYLARLVSSNLEDIFKEIQATLQFEGAGVVPIHSWCQYVDKRGVKKVELFEPLYSKTMADALNDPDSLSDGKKMRIALILLYALSRIEELGIHCDIKSQNLLFDDEKGVVFADFGFYQAIGAAVLRQKGSLWWVAPECLLFPEEQHLKRDVWSLGLVFLSLFYGGVPWWFCEQEGEPTVQVIAELEEDWLGDWIPESDPFSPIVRDMLQVKPDKRITAAEAYNRMYEIYQKSQADISGSQPT